MTTPILRALWCDDIRQEVGNKPSFMGVFTGGLVLPTLPINLSRMSVWLTIEGARPHAESQLGLRIVTDSGIALMEVAANRLGTPPPDDGAADGPVIHAEVTMGPVPLPQDCKHLKLIAEIDGTTLESKPLRVSVDPVSLARAGVVPIPASPDASQA